MTDPFEPDWSKAPKWALWHAVTRGGCGIWSRREVFVIQNTWGPIHWYYGGKFDVSTADWRNSLRYRPEVAQ
jgi:hypothetical protein